MADSKESYYIEIVGVKSYNPYWFLLIVSPLNQTLQGHKNDRKSSQLKKFLIVKEVLLLSIMVNL